MKKLIALLLFTLSLNADTITMRADEWCPYNCNPKSDKPGFMIEIAKEVFEKAGHKVKYETTNWARALREAGHGHIDAVVGTNKSEGEPYGLIYPDIEQGYSSFAFFVKKDDNWKFDGVDSLKQIMLGVVHGYVYEGEIQKYIEANLNNRTKLMLSYGEDAGSISLKNLKEGKVDAALDNLYVGNYNALNLGISHDVRVCDTMCQNEPNYIAFSPKNPKSKEYAKILEKGTEELRKSGKLKVILAKYGLEDWKK